MKIRIVLNVFRAIFLDKIKVRYRYHIFFYVISFILPNSSVYGQDDLIRTTLWQVVKPGAKDTSYLFGTNFLSMDTYVLKNTIILRKLEASKYFISEQNYFLSSIANYRLDPDSIRWHNYATRHQKKRIRDFFHCEKCFSNPDVVHMNIYYLKRWFNSILGYFNSYRLSRNNGAYFMNYDLQLRVKNRRKIVELESQRENHFYFMLDATRGVPQTEEVVKGNIYELDSMIGVLRSNEFRIFPNKKDTLLDVHRETLDNYYKNIVRYHFSEKSEHPFDSVLLENRNKNWLPTIVQYMNKSSCFISVDLEHLKYKYGLIQLLKADGYIVEPILLEERKK